ncbi:PLP-dependent aminotransferase family protein [Propionivibrio limicola]|uniref:aminotransferase-like domain-containing protein n=1 Tax=Propionivibrio limicola TaxID=167645 RepID=UPI001292BB02|nr:PLP-dependent aminotransferase family protein [Propionivibrio limicola]
MTTNALKKAAAASCDSFPSPDFDALFSARARAIESSAIREILKVTERPEVISFAGGLPAPETFPVEETRAALDRVLTTAGREALQYSTTEGYAPLREWIAARVSTPESPVSPDEVLMVSGSQQGLDLLAKVLINPGDTVLVETPTYLGALQAFSLFSPKYVSIAADADGLLPEAMDASLRGAKFLYCLPNFQNPTGRLLPEDRRRRLAEKARELDLLILEDDPYGELSYAGDTPPSIRSLAPERTVYMGSFSKVLAPGIRLGYVIAPEALRAKLVQAKQATDLHTATLSQMAAYEVVKDGFLDSHIPTIRELYGKQCQAMLDALERHMPEGVTWNRPKGGMFLWVELPKGMDASAILAKAVAQNVAFVPGEPFYAANPVKETLRLAFVTVPPPRIEEGVKRLADVIRASR